MRIARLDDFLARRTPGRLVLYYLAMLLTAAFLLSALGLISQGPVSLAFTTIFLMAACWTSNWAFAKAFGARSNPDSVLITALILALIVSPVRPGDWSGLLSLAFAALWGTASKYVLCIDRRHIFNPAAFGAAITSLLTGHAASWWIGSYWLMPLVSVGGILLMRKIRCFDVIVPFLIVTLGVIALTAFPGYAGMFVWEMLTRSALLFFAFAMLTEPRTLPFGGPWRIAFGALVGILYVPGVHIGSLRLAPETALLAGNIFAAIAKRLKKWQSARRYLSATAPASTE